MEGEEGEEEEAEVRREPIVLLHTAAAIVYQKIYLYTSRHTLVALEHVGRCLG